MEKTPTEILVKNEFSLRIKLLSILLLILAIFVVVSIIQKDLVSLIISIANLIIALAILLTVKNQKQKRINEMHERINASISEEKPQKKKTSKKKK
jgi:Na+/H+ antiporter NhaD/arsenite permease-like protein